MPVINATPPTMHPTMIPTLLPPELLTTRLPGFSDEGLSLSLDFPILDKIKVKYSKF